MYKWLMQKSDFWFVNCGASFSTSKSVFSKLFVICFIIVLKGPIHALTFVFTFIDGCPCSCYLKYVLYRYQVRQ